MYPPKVIAIKYVLTSFARLTLQRNDKVNVTLNYVLLKNFLSLGNKKIKDREENFTINKETKNRNLENVSARRNEE